MTPISHHPACCSPLQDHWPLPFALPGVQLISTRFDPSLLDPEDFTRCGVPGMSAVSKRQTEFLAGRLCAREALRRATGEPCTPAVNEDRSPCWPTGAVGSITHGAGWAAAVVARHEQWRGIGLDVEKRLPPTRADRLVAEILTPRELEGYVELDEAQRALLVTLTFSLKESLFKALYPLVNKRFYFQEAELIDHDSTGRARLRLLSDLSEEWKSGAELDGQFVQFEDDYLLSLVSIPA
ncbi:4'-phosphopantetheinyl transferase superfamily protein [Stutzerimonas zhaodongensis]|uniref:Enterobactin synthase component D n=1 Tax=Stutzerimonas zhaodongensis TaxID=1176257 RepID=A0A3M2HVT9_9GAMM|nr:4'-phosphopantetheinyl transferase superfamily protein [Stutzerimonas zhaodongensis]MCQ4314900.1 4'-phosphopantetheinyl transferase superfamily protein [Stutzerimonas zhaodongensis]RMH92395.1 4'-phosphopantetheinyl transferase superfamily protein [Stutzerimonas zhaodongensis]